jgi:hypothetical protein
MPKRKSETRNDVLKYVMLISVVVAFIAFMIYAGPSLGLTAAVNDDIIAAMPGLILITVGLVSLTRTNGAFMVISMLGIGFGLAILLRSLYITGIVIDSMLWGLTLEQNMTMIIILSGVIGAIMMTATSRRD